MLASVASTRIWTFAFPPRARSRPKCCGMMSAPRATLDSKASCGLTVGRPTHHAERDRGAEGVNVVARGGGVVEILNDHRKIGDGEGDRRAEKKQ